MNDIFEIRNAIEADASEISELIYSTSIRCSFTPKQECPDWYKESVAPNQIAKLLRHEQMAWIVATQAMTITGVLAISEKSHVKYFFVHPEYQKLGIGKQLWHFANINNLLSRTITVRSSLVAVPVYKRLGFQTTEPPKTFNGIHYQTMQASLN